MQLDMDNRFAFAEGRQALIGKCEFVLLCDAEFTAAAVVVMEYWLDLPQWIPLHFTEAVTRFCLKRTKYRWATGR